MNNRISSVSSFFALPFQLIKCLGIIFITPKYLLPLIVPYLIGIVSFFCTVIWGLNYRGYLSNWLLSSTESWWQIGLDYLLVGVSVLLIFIISSLISIIVILLIADTFIEIFIDRAFPRYGFKSQDIPFSFKTIISSTFKLLKSNIQRILMIVILTVITIICGFIPILLFIPPIIAAFLSGFDLVFTPLMLLEIQFSDCWRICKAHLPEVLALGAILLLMMLIPLGGVLFLPAAYFLTLDKMSSWKELEPYK